MDARRRNPRASAADEVSAAQVIFTAVLMGALVRLILWMQHQAARVEVLAFASRVGLTRHD